MRGLSVICLIGIFNAFYWGIKNQWMFEPTTKRGGDWWIGNAAVGLACFIVAIASWNVAKARSQNRLAALYYEHSEGRASEDEVIRAAMEHDKEFGSS